MYTGQHRDGLLLRPVPPILLRLRRWEPRHPPTLWSPHPPQLRRSLLRDTPLAELHLCVCALRTSGPVVVAGFGRDPLSLPAQLAALSPSLIARFSYCLVSHSFKKDHLLQPSPLILGRTEPKPSAPDKYPPFIHTPLLHNPKHPYFYFVGLESLSVRSNQIWMPPELRDVDRKVNSGMVVDSGTTFTMLPAETYTSLAYEFDQQMSRAGF
ncbi:probable aspartyl protease At4g16563 [Zingiber officinale]|uniref:Xylanase inhibitor C-terminal domain-containing protein n=1 Tax=Zingiber officinale TaxID=94328 RepID=A0A8J5FUU8_ZINOF|nr:probable aspartyl protease At4g16563 [Zingiber officinale]KAG6495390.1 hypothetical protein ZIOFF_043193 [Zingiber officinale]